MSSDRGSAIRQPQVAGQSGTVVDLPGYRAQSEVNQLLVLACKDLNPCKVGWIAGFATIDFERSIKYQLGAVQKTHPNIKVVAYQDGGGYLADPAFKIAQNMLQAHPDINLLATSGDQMTLGAEIAVKGAGGHGKIRIISGGLSCPGQKAVQMVAGSAGRSRCQKRKGRSVERSRSMRRAG